MNLFAKKPITISVVNNEMLHFIEPDPENRYRILASIPVFQFIEDESDLTEITTALKNRENKLLIVPDFWLSNTKYPFQSNKESLIESFIERKLQTEYAEQSELKDFFEYNAYDSQEDGKMLHILFYQDPVFFQLYNKLSSLGLMPQRVTASVFLCEHEVNKNEPDLHKGGKGIIHLGEFGCFLYFFAQGNFLFERTIMLPDTEPGTSESGTSERLNLLSYEITQSLHLFSQKSKAQLSQFYLLSSSQEDMSDISESLGSGVEVKDLSQLLIPSDQSDNNLSKEIGPFASFNATDIFSSNKLKDIPQRQQKRELEWKPVQLAGIAIGMFLLLIIGLESGYIWHRLSTVKQQIRSNRSMTDFEVTEKIQQYNESLDLLLEETTPHTPSRIITNMIAALPDNYQPTEIEIEAEQNPSLKFSGSAEVKDVDSFKKSLSVLVSNINKQIPVQQEMGLQDVKFKTGKNRFDTTKTNYLIDVNVGLN